MLNVLTMPIEGTPAVGAGKPEQKPIEDLAALMNDVLEDPMVEAIRWYQYTPYFNDGEPCIFGTGEINLKLVDGDPESGDYEDGFINHYFNEFKQTIGTVHVHWATKTADVLPGAANPELAEAWATLYCEFNTDCYDDALYQKYGDHAIITVDKLQNKVIIEYYEHD